MDPHQDAQLPLSVLFSAYRDGDYLGKGEENLTFSGTTIDTAQAFDARWDKWDFKSALGYYYVRER